LLVSYSNSLARNKMDVANSILEFLDLIQTITVKNAVFAGRTPETTCGGYRGVMWRTFFVGSKYVARTDGVQEVAAMAIRTCGRILLVASHPRKSKKAVNRQHLSAVVGDLPIQGVDVDA